jgi:predicted DNA-binding ribbon-helix-helix protein
MKRSQSFAARERSTQAAYFAEHLSDERKMDGYPYRLAATGAGRNLAPSIRVVAERYFAERPDGAITWHRHANHALSSQVCCLNFLMPLAERPDLLARLVHRAVGGSIPMMQPVEDGPDGRPWFVGFEWVGGNYLNEANTNGKLTRGANATSADAVVRFTQDGSRHVLLIEWKYTESYGQPLQSTERVLADGTRRGGNHTRLERYRDLAFDPKGPLKTQPGLSLEDFFWEPFYQLLRQQMLACQMQKNKDADKVRVLHVSPAGNRELHAVTSPALRRFGNDAFRVFRTLLSDESAFINTTTEDLFGPLLADPGDATEWADYLKTRYTFLADSH